MPSVMATTSGNPRVRRLQNGVGGKGRRHEDDRSIGPGLATGLAHRVEHRNAVHARAALARRHAGHNFGAVSYGLLSVERALAAGDALDQQTRVFVNKILMVSLGLTRPIMTLLLSGGRVEIGRGSEIRPSFQSSFLSDGPLRSCKLG